MSVRVVVVYHSEGGRTRALAEAACRGAASVEGVEASAIDASTARESLEELARADAIIFGAPTYMGSASSAFTTGGLGFGFLYFASQGAFCSK